MVDTTDTMKEKLGCLQIRAASYDVCTFKLVSLIYIEYNLRIEMAKKWIIVL